MASLDPAVFRRKLMEWYRLHARVLPWRGISDPYRTWISEVMLQQTRVAAVIEHYRLFLERFPSLEVLAKASEPEVLAVWSGLGYYRRARMLHKATRFVVQELGGQIPPTASELRSLPGVGAYTAAAIASIAFGESVAVVDGNVERVLLRMTGRSEDATAAGKLWVQQQATALVPPARKGTNAPGDHNQAMMELGATICLPRAPLCLNCPVFALCETRGEHKVIPRGKVKSRPAAFLLQVSGESILLEQRSDEVSLMAGMYELPPLPLRDSEGRVPELRLRHSITDTVYEVAIYQSDKEDLSQLIPLRTDRLHSVLLSNLTELPITGLTRKVLRRLKLIP